MDIILSYFLNKSYKLPHTAEFDEYSDDKDIEEEVKNEVLYKISLTIVCAHPLKIFDFLPVIALIAVFNSDKFVQRRVTFRKNKGE